MPAPRRCKRCGRLSDDTPLVCPRCGKTDYLGAMAYSLLGLVLVSPAALLLPGASLGGILLWALATLGIAQLVAGVGSIALPHRPLQGDLLAADIAKNDSDGDTCLSALEGVSGDIHVEDIARNARDSRVRIG